MSKRYPFIAQGPVTVFVFLCIFLLSSLIAESWAVGNIHFGRAEIQPAFQIKETYNDNIEVADPKVRSDWITTCSAGVQLKWPFRQHLLAGDWLIVIPQYAKYTRWNFQEHRLSTKGSFLFDRGGNRFGLDLSHFSLKSPDAPELGQSRQKRLENHFIHELKVGFKDNIRFDLKYEILRFRFDEQLDDRHENRSSMTVNLQTLPKTTGFISARYGHIEYENTSTDSSYWGITPGIRWDATAKLSGQLSGGFQWKDYESEDRDDIDTWIAMVDLNHRLSDYTNLSLGLDVGDREYSTSWSDGEEIVKSFHNYILYKAQVLWKQQLTYKIGMRLSFTYQHDDYQGAIDRQNRIYFLDFGVKYQPQEWLVMDLGLQHKRLFSQGNSPQKEYSNNIVSLSLGLVL